jgi:hypothetical protein
VTNTAAHAISGVAASGSSGNAVNAQVTGSASGSAGNFAVTNAASAVPAVTVSNTGSSGTGVSIAASGTGAGGGKALEITNGRIVLSYGGTVGAGALSNLKSVYEVNDGVGSSAPVVTMPTSTENGQVVYVYVADPDGATVNGIGLAAGVSATFVYVNGAWRRF